jgi:hypothetical protein
MATDRHLLQITCPVCGSVWAGAERAHCTGCHHSFDDVALFDAHREHGHCQHPGELHLIRTRNGIWLAPLTSRGHGQRRRAG